MAIYHYHALDVKGKSIKGHVEAHSEREAKDLLREQGAMITKLVLKTKNTLKQQLKGENLVTFTVQLSQLIGAGVPLYESLIAIEEQYRQEPYHHIMMRL